MFADGCFWPFLVRFPYSLVLTTASRSMKSFFLLVSSTSLRSQTKHDKHVSTWAQMLKMPLLRLFLG